MFLVCHWSSVGSHVCMCVCSCVFWGGPLVANRRCCLSDPLSRKWPSCVWRVDCEPPRHLNSLSKNLIRCQAHFVQGVGRVDLSFTYKPWIGPSRNQVLTWTARALPDLSDVLRARARFLSSFFLSSVAEEMKEVTCLKINEKKMLI